MRRVLIAVAAPAALCAALSACGPSGSVAPAPSSHSAPTSPPAVGVPPAPQPATTADCPYLTKSFVENANGQHVDTVRISAGQPHPTCFFYRPDGGLQVTVRVYAGDQNTARAVVNQAAPVSSSDPASDPAGWQGGLQSTSDGAVYAVSKGGDAVVVTTNQAQTIKARRIAVQAITGLGM